MAERESLIEALHSELESARADVQRVRSESEHMEQQLRLKINDLESTIGELVSYHFMINLLYCKYNRLFY